MWYLAQCPARKVLVEARDWNHACELIRLSGQCPHDKSPVMIAGFADAVRDVYPCMADFHWNTAGTQKSLAGAIQVFAEAAVELSWLGSKDAESHDEIRREYAESKEVVETLLGTKLPKD
jgi:hypothetical protein